MKTILSKLPHPSTLVALLLVGAAAAGCDDGTGEPVDRDARVQMVLDGEVVRSWDVEEPAQLHAELLVWDAVDPSADVCEDGERELAFVLEQGDEELASHEACAPAGSQAIDTLTASPDPQGNFWCNSCAAWGSCFECCKCAGETTSYCISVC